MLHVRSLREGLPLFRALNSELRVSVMELLYRQGPMHMSAIASTLGITAGALTPHIRALEECGLIVIELTGGKHGVQKVCRAAEEGILIEMTQQQRTYNTYESQIGVGQYTGCQVSPTCGLCTPQHLIGEVDDPRYFLSPEHFDAEILWFGHGYVEYTLPCFLQEGQELVEIQLSMEISSEAPGCAEDWPSDVYFAMNGVELGYWTSPGDFGRVAGINTPDWFPRSWNQHGLYKLLSVNGSGTYMDGTRIADTRLRDLHIVPGEGITFRLYVPESAKHVGGLTIFGRSFGNYPQDIRMRMHYRDLQAESL